jgi:quercetin dioxygenase-like cupin family protein
MAVESGDPSKSGEFVVQLSFPDGYAIPPHFHPTAEHVRVQSGTFLVGMGDNLDAKATKPMAAGDTGSVPAKMHHFGIAKGATVVRVRAEGPFAMTYVNAADTPKP